MTLKTIDVPLTYGFSVASSTVNGSFPVDGPLPAGFTKVGMPPYLNAPDDGSYIEVVSPASMDDGGSGSGPMIYIAPADPSSLPTVPGELTITFRAYADGPSGTWDGHTGGNPSGLWARTGAALVYKTTMPWADGDPATDPGATSNGGGTWEVLTRTFSNVFITQYVTSRLNIYRWPRSVPPYNPYPAGVSRYDYVGISFTYDAPEPPASSTVPQLRLYPRHDKRLYPPTRSRGIRPTGYL